MYSVSTARSSAPSGVALYITYLNLSSPGIISVRQPQSGWSGTAYFPNTEIDPSLATVPLQSISTSFECHESVHTAWTASDFGSHPIIRRPSCNSLSNDQEYSTERN